LAGADSTGIYAGADASANVAENNVLPALILLAKAGMAAYTLYEVYDKAQSGLELLEQFNNGTLKEDQLKDKLIDLGIDLAIDVTAGKVSGPAVAVLGTLAGKSGLGARFEAIYRKIADGGGNNTGNDKYTGGAHKDTSKPKGDGLDSHHCPAKNCYKNAPISSADGPAIKMDPADHKYTSSYGSSRAAKEYRARQKDLVNQGD
jgi:hypothetical protein